jgi:hypothetical protein
MLGDYPSAVSGSALPVRIWLFRNLGREMWSTGVRFGRLFGNLVSGIGSGLTRLWLFRNLRMFRFLAIGFR